MKIDRKRNSVRNMLWGWINKVITILGPFVIRTIILKVLGTEYLGLSSLFISILQVLSVAELGFSSAIVYSMYKPIAQEDEKTICALLNLYKNFYRLIGCIILGIGLLLMPFLPNLINGSYPDDINIYLIYLLYLFNSVLSYFLFAYKSSLLQAHQRNDIESNIATVLQLGMYACQIIVLLLYKNYYVYIIFMPIFTLLTNTVSAIMVNKMFPTYICKGKLNTDMTKQIRDKVGSLVIYKIGNVVSNSVDNLVISAFLGLSFLAIYGNYYYVLLALFGILAIYYNSMRAGMGNSLVVESVSKNYNDFNNLLFIQGWIIGWCSICLVVLYQPFMQLWVGKDLMFSMSMVILFAVYFYVWKIHDIVHTYKEALGMWDVDRFRPLISSGVNLVLNIIMVKYIGIGIYGIVLSTILSELFVTLPWAPRVLYNGYFHKNAFIYYSKLLKYLTITIIVGSITYFVCIFLPSYGWIWLIIKFIICVIIPNSLFALVYVHNKECNEVFQLLRKEIKRY